MCQLVPFKARLFGMLKFDSSRLRQSALFRKREELWEILPSASFWGTGVEAAVNLARGDGILKEISISF